jgi:hypothetical protein
MTAELQRCKAATAPNTPRNINKRNDKRLFLSLATGAAARSKGRAARPRIRQKIRIQKKKRGFQKKKM